MNSDHISALFYRIIIVINRPKGLAFKESIKVISSDPPLKECMSDLERYPLNPFLSNNKEDIVLILSGK